MSLFRGVGARGQELGRGGLGWRRGEPWNGLGERTQMQTGICMAFPPCLPSCPPPPPTPRPRRHPSWAEQGGVSMGKWAPERKCHRSSLSQLTNCQKVLEKGSKGKGRKKGMTLCWVPSLSFIHSLSLGADLCLTRLRRSGPRSRGGVTGQQYRGPPVLPTPSAIHLFGCQGPNKGR